MKTRSYTCVDCGQSCSAGAQRCRPCNDRSRSGLGGPALPWEPPPPWVDDALCTRTGSPDEWYPEKGGSSRIALLICGRCYVRAECLAYALDHGERHGIWGGVSAVGRERLAREDVA